MQGVTEVKLYHLCLRNMSAFLKTAKNVFDKFDCYLLFQENLGLVDTVGTGGLLKDQQH